MYHDTYQSQYAIIIANNMRVAEVSLCLAAYLIVPESCVSNYWAIRAVYSWSCPTFCPRSFNWSIGVYRGPCKPNFSTTYDAEFRSPKEESGHAWKVIIWEDAMTVEPLLATRAQRAFILTSASLISILSFGEWRRSDCVYSHCSCVPYVLMYHSGNQKFIMEFRGDRCACHGFYNIRNGVYFNIFNVNLA